MTSTVALVIDDSAVARMAAVQQLRQLGYAPIGLANPVAALVAIHDLEPAIIILDLDMPGLSGEGLAVKIKEEWPDTRIVFWSASDRVYSAAAKAGVLGLSKGEPLSKAVAA